MKRQRAERGGRRAERSPPGGCAQGLAHPRPAGAHAGRRSRLVARRGRTVAFVEVKARATAEEAATALDEFRLRRVAAAAERSRPLRAPATTSASTRCSSSPAACPATCQRLARVTSARRLA
jgi:putative endonuclease